VTLEKPACLQSHHRPLTAPAVRTQAEELVKRQVAFCRGTAQRVSSGETATNVRV
jgi:hypothetical protein